MCLLRGHKYNPTHSTYHGKVKTCIRCMKPKLLKCKKHDYVTAYATKEVIQQVCANCGKMRMKRNEHHR